MVISIVPRLNFYQMFGDFRGPDVDIVAHVLHLLEARLEHVDLAAHFSLTIAVQRQERREDVLESDQTYRFSKTSNIISNLFRNRKMKAPWLTQSKLMPLKMVFCTQNHF
jgi:hypothetical protein